MRRTHAVLLSAGLFLGSLTLTPAALAEGEQTDNVPPPPQVEQTAPDAQAQAPVVTTPAQPQDNAAQPAAPNNYDLTTIVIDYKEYKVGDVVPDEYRGKSYIISEWQPRHLPAPQEDTHWAYINANYILITNDTGKIVMAKSGDIFFKG